MTDKCEETVKHSILKFEDEKPKDPKAKVKSVFYIDNRKKHREIKRKKVDGCSITDETIKKCDWLATVEGMENNEKSKVKLQAEIFIELKGEDINEAAKQLTSTIDNLPKDKDKVKAKEKLGVVVATQVIPKQRDKLVKQVYQSHKLILLVEKTPYTETIENLLSELGLK